MKNFCKSPSRNETPQTNALVDEVQSRPIPFEVAYWRLLELTRMLEVENVTLREAWKAKNKIAAQRRPGGIKAKPIRRA